MIEQYQEEQRRKTARIRSIVDYVMGSLLFLLGLFFLIYGFLGWKMMGREHNDLDYVIGGLFVVYGVWRVYRGIKKNYPQ